MLYVVNEETGQPAVPPPDKSDLAAATWSSSRRQFLRIGAGAAGLAAAGAVWYMEREVSRYQRQKRADEARQSGIHITVQHLDSGYDLVLPNNRELTAAQENILRSWSLNSKDPTGVLNGLIADLRAKGGANPNELFLRISFKNQLPQPITVVNIRPVILRRSKPYNGTFLSIPPQGEGGADRMIFNFDEITPSAREVVGPDGDEKPGDPFFSKMTLEFKVGEAATLGVKSITTRWAVNYNIRIDYVIGGVARSLIVDDHGHPFAITPMNCIDRTSLDKAGQPTRSGHVSYQEIWKLRDDFQGIDPVNNPHRFQIGPPYC